MLKIKTKLFKLSCTTEVIVTLNIQCTYGKLGRNTIPLIAMRSACAKVAILFWKSPNRYSLVAAMQRLEDDLFRPNNLETAANGVEVSLKRFEKSRKLLNFRNANYSTENSRNSGSKIEWKENLGIPREFVLFLDILENAVPLDTGSCRKFKQNFLVEWKRVMESALYFGELGRDRKEM